jgi:hypothetical protein
LNAAPAKGSPTMTPKRRRTSMVPVGGRHASPPRP